MSRKQEAPLVHGQSDMYHERENRTYDLRPTTHDFACWTWQMVDTEAERRLETVEAENARLRQRLDQLERANAELDARRRAAEERRAWLDLALAAADLFAWEIDAATDALAASSNVAHVLGFPLPDTAAGTMTYLQQTDDGDEVRHFERARHGEAPLDAEYRLVHPTTGEVVWVRAQGRLLTGANGARLIGVTQNITDRKRAEMALRESEARLQIALDAAKLGTWDLDLDTRIATVSTRLAEMLGIAPGQRRLEPEEWQRLALGHPALFQAGPATTSDRDIPFELEFSVPPRSGARSRWIHAWATVERDAAGRPRRLLGVAMDTTVRKEVEAALREREARQSLLLELGDRLRVLSDTDAMTAVAGELLGRHLKVSRVVYSEMDEDDDAGTVWADWTDGTLPSMRGHFRLDLFGLTEDYRQGRIRRVNDARSDVPDGQSRDGHRAMGIRAAIGVPMLKAGRLVASMAVHSPTPRAWTDAEVDLVREAGERIRTEIERARAETALRESQAQLLRAIEIETVGVIFFRADGAITYANDAFLRMSGYTRQDSEQGLLRWDAMTPVEWMPHSQRAIDELLTHGQTVPYEKEYLRKDGSRWWALFAAKRITDDEGVEFIIDITASKRAEAERARLATIVETSRDAILSCTPDGTITAWNHGAEELYGYAAAEIVGRNIGLLLPPERAGEQEEIFRRLQRGERIPPLMTTRLRQDGSRVEVEIRASAIVDAAGRVIGVSSIGRDATERKQLERAQQDFIAMASHDLSTPITVIRGQAQLMRRRGAYNAEGLAAILEQARRMERLVDDLHEVVRLEAGAPQLRRAEVDLGALAREAAARAPTAASSHTVRVEAPPAPIVGFWDRDRLGQILDNLLGNAVKYSRPGGEIVVRVAAVAGEARLSVEDSGEGIARDALPMLFARFYRANPAGSASGLGIGLYIARILVEAHGGRIWVTSEPDAGSTFTFALPLT